MSDRIGAANGNGNNGNVTRYAAWASFVFNSGTIQPRSGATYFQNGYARTSATSTDTQYDTSKPVTISLAGSGTHEFNATGGNIFITPSAQMRDQAGQAGTLLKTGTGSLIFTGNGPVAVNDWTGASTVNAGTLSVDYSQIAGTATMSGTTALSNAYSANSQLVLNGGNFSLTGRSNASASSLTNASLNAATFNLTVTSTAGLVVGQAVTNANLPAGTYIRRFINGTTVELNAMITGTTNLTGQTFDFAAANFTNSQTINSVSLQQSGTVTVNPAGDSTVLTFGTVAGTAGFTKAGIGLLVLSGSNTFSGGATLSAGTLALNNSSALGTGTFTLSGGVIDNTSAGAIANSQNNVQNWNGDFTFAGTRDLDLGTGAVTLSANRQVTTTAGVLTVGGVIGGGALNLTKSGNGMLRLTGSSTYSGTTAISAGTLQIGGGGTTGAIAAGAVSVASGGLLSFNRTDNYGGDFANVISGSGNVELLSGTLTYTGANSYTGTTTIAAGQLSIGSGTNVGSIAGPIANNAALVFNRSNALAYAGVISGSGTVTKAGAGTLTLSGSSTYTGKTAISGGGISINSIGNVNGRASALGNPDSVANGTIDVGGNSTLTFTGSTAAATDRKINLGMGSSGGTIVHSGSGRLTLDGAIAVNVTSAWSLNPTGAGSEILVNGLVSGNGGNGLFVNGSGTVTLANSSNSFSGPLQLYQGTVSVASMANSGSNSPLGAGTSLAFGNSSYNLTGRLLFTGASGGASNRTITIVGGSAGTGLTNGGILENNVAGQTLTLSGNVTATGSTPSLQLVGAGDGVLSGNISDGAGDLTITKNGAGTWTLSGSNAYSGATSVSQGTLQFSSVSSIGSSSGVSAAAGALLAYSGATSGTLALSISGAGGFTQSGGGTLALSGSNGFTGATSLNAGTLALASANALAGTGTMSFGGGTLQYGSANQADFSAIIRSSTGAIAIDTNNQTVAFVNTLDASNIGGLSKSGAGTLRLSGSNGYTGSTTVSAGTLDFSTVNALRNSSGVNIASGAILRYSGTANTFDRTITVTGGVGTVTNSGGNTLTLAGTLTKDGTVLQLSGGAFNVTGQIVGSSSNSDLYVNGASVTLSNTNTYNGPTFVFNSGTLALGVSNAIPNNSVVTLGASGTSSATGPGTLHLGTFTNTIGGLVFSGSGNTLKMAANQTASAQLVTSGSLSIGAGTTLDLAGMGTSAGLYKLVSYTANTGTFATVNGLAAGYQLVYGTTELDAQQKAVLGTVTVTNPITSIITGGSAAFTYAVANGAASGGATLAFTGTGLSNVIGLSSGSAASGGASGPIGGLLFTGMDIGANQQGTFTVNAADAFGMTTSTGTVTVMVLDHATSSLGSGATAVLSAALNLGTWDYSKGAWTSGTNSGLFSIYNLASSHGASLTADLSLLNVSGTGNGFTTNLGSYTDIAGGQSGQYSVSVDPTSFLTSGTQSWTFTIAMQDKTGMAGATPTNTLSVTANVVVVPEPATIWLVAIGVGVAGWAAMGRRRAWSRPCSTGFYVAAFFAASIGASAIGCTARAPVDLVPVEGQVTLDGKPLTGVAVVFSPDSEGNTRGPMSIGWLAADGRYDLRSVRGFRGAVPGKHRVYLYDPSRIDAELVKPHIVGLPAELLAPETSGLTASLDVAKPNTVDFALTRHGTPAGVGNK